MTHYRGPTPFQSMNIFILSAIPLFKQHGAEEARRAHNPKDGGSKPPAATFFFFPFSFSPERLSCDLYHSRVILVDPKIRYTIIYVIFCH